MPIPFALTPDSLKVGGTYPSPSGYWHIYIAKHPNSKNGCLPLHRWIMELHLGRFLSKGEVVHHKDGNTKNNRIENLQLCKSISDHMEKHHRPKKGEKCKNCGGHVNRVFRKHGKPPLCYPCRFPKRRCRICKAWPTIKGLCHKHYQHATTRINCSKCGMEIGSHGRNVFPPRCWTCAFPKQVCTLCGGKYMALGLCDNHYHMLKRGTLKKHFPNFASILKISPDK